MEAAKQSKINSYANKLIHIALTTIDNIEILKDIIKFSVVYLAWFLFRPGRCVFHRSLAVRNTPFGFVFHRQRCLRAEGVFFTVRCCFHRMVFFSPEGVFFTGEGGHFHFCGCGFHRRLVFHRHRLVFHRHRLPQVPKGSQRPS